VYDWDATAGRHQIQVRATDGTGETQTEERTPPAPSGARGWPSVDVSVG
jgi:sulfite oxidase